MEFALPQSVPRMCVKLELSGSEDLYRTLQQEVGLGVEALKSGSPEIAASLFQSAIHKVNLEHPFHAHLIYDLLLSYSLLIEQLLKSNDESTVHYFVQSALQLEIGSRQVHEPAIRKRFSAGFQSLGVMLLKHGLSEASLLCSCKANSILDDAGSYRAPNVARTRERPKSSELTILAEG